MKSHKSSIFNSGLAGLGFPNMVDYKTVSTAGEFVIQTSGSGVFLLGLPIDLNPAPCFGIVYHGLNQAFSDALASKLIIDKQVLEITDHCGLPGVGMG